MPKSIIKLISADGVVFPVDQRDARCLGIVNVMLDIQTSAGSREIPLPHVESNILGKVLHWVAHHLKEDCEPQKEEEEEEKDEVHISGWDKEFLVSMDQKTLIDLMLAAYYLNITGLIEVTCKHMASMIRGKTPEQIRTTFNIQNDLPPN